MLEEIQRLRLRVEQLEKKAAETQTTASAGSVLTNAAAQKSPLVESTPARGWRSFQSFNPEISAIVDMFYHADDSADGISKVTENMSGFGRSHSGEGHAHGAIENGFNMRHLELQFSAGGSVALFLGLAVAGSALVAHARPQPIKSK